MRRVELRLLLSLILVLVGAIVLVGLNVEYDADRMILHSQTQLANEEQKSLASVGILPSALPAPRTDLEIVRPVAASLIILVCILRC
jgi:hypothetical protein